MNTKTLIGACVLAIAVSGCATILNGPQEKVQIVSTPEQALCRIYRESTGYLKAVATPGAVYIPRSAEPIRVVCKKDGYQTTEVVASPHKTADVVKNGLGLTAGGPFFLFGVLVDNINGASQDLPDTISVNLKAYQ